jgi:hypothetical protein
MGKTSASVLRRKSSQGLEVFLERKLAGSARVLLTRNRPAARCVTADATISGIRLKL